MGRTLTARASRPCGRSASPISRIVRDGWTAEIVGDLLGDEHRLRPGCCRRSPGWPSAPAGAAPPAPCSAFIWRFSSRSTSRSGTRRRASRRSGAADGVAHSVLHWRPSGSMMRSASTGPQVPHWYSGRSRTRCRCQWSRMRHDELPRRLDRVAAHEQRRVAGHHVEQEPLVGLRRACRRSSWL